MTRFRALTLFVCALFAAPLAAQTSNASVSGRIKDTTGAVIPGATVSVKNTDTNVIRTSESNAEGIYTIPNLIPGTYTLSAIFQGFKNLEQGPFPLRVGDRVTLDLTMEVGAQTERVTVTAEVPLLRTEDVQTGLVIDNRRIQELPQYNRNALAFATLTPNVNGTSDVGSHDNDLRINGGRTAQMEYYIDGQPVTTGYRHDVPNSVPSMEAVGEFKVLTNGLSAEYGRLSGGAVVLVTRSGTNEFHGSAYEYFKNDKLNANDWNSNRYGRAKGVFHENVFGATIGGPVRLPKLYNGTDRTFFFFNYEGARYRSGSNARFASVPTSLERSGDFSQSLIDSGYPVQIFDPLTAQSVNNRVVRLPFAGNKVPESRIDPISKIYLGYYPQPNTAPKANSSHDNNFIGASTNPSENDRYTGRLDQNWSTNHTTHFSLVRRDDKSASTRWLSPLQAVGTSFGTAHTITLDHTWTMSPTTLVTARGGVVRRTWSSGNLVDADASDWGLQPEVVLLLGTTKGRVPTLQTGDTLTNIGGGNSNDQWETSYNASLAVQKLWGKHTLKFGYEHRRYYSNYVSGGEFGLASQRSVTSQYFDQPVPTGSGFAGWLLGAVTWGSGTELAGPASLQTYHGAYFQDDIKLTSKWTLNAGIRWDFEPPRTERFDRQIFWDRNYKWDWQPNAGWNWDKVQQQAAVSGAAAPQWLTNGIYGRAAITGTPEYPERIFQETYPYHFGPRVGAAYQIDSKTVARIGYGINWMTMTGNSFMNGAVWNVGYGGLARLTQGGSPDGGLTFPLSFKTPMPGGQGYVPPTRSVAELNQKIMGQWFISGAENMSPGYEHVLQLGIQREVGSGPDSWVFELAYNGNLGRDLPFWHGMGEHILPNAYHILGPYGEKLFAPVDNPYYGRIPSGGNAGKTLPFGRMYTLNPLWNEIWTFGDPLGTSNYHSAYIQAEHRFGRGFTFLANYTFGKQLQDVGAIEGQRMQGQGGQAFPQAGLGLGDIYGLSVDDIRHKLLFNYSWDLPFGRGKSFMTNAPAVVDKIFGGWRVAGTTTFRAGTPTYAYIGSGGVGGLGSQWYNIGHSRTSRPVFVVPRVGYDGGVDGHTALEGSAGYSPYVIRDSMRLPLTLSNNVEIGDVPSAFTDLRDPGFSQWDFSVLKNFPFAGEQRYVQFRMEAENLFNQMNPGSPGRNIVARDFGMITGQRGNPRRIMLALKLYF
ncbi:MAG: carboxypeptidase regulatory-like domain-containing protein [Bryobacterales bacterium]|nr:carboxypeptidase regulatory-like domain-containing protein [Bryobacterales bacterium]